MIAKRVMQLDSAVKAIFFGMMTSGWFFGMATEARSDIRSPFQGPDASAPPSTQPAQTLPAQLEALEFTGITSVAGSVTFSLYDSKENYAYWVPLHGSDGEVSVTDYDAELGSISVSVSGFTRQISINANEIVPLAAGASGNAPFRSVTPKPVYVKDDVTLMKEEEARLFVSDILESSMKRRAEIREEREKRLKEQREKAKSRR